MVICKISWTFYGLSVFPVYIIVEKCIIRCHYVPPSDVDECLRNPCIHDGVCRNTNGSYVCDCPEQYTGKNCELGMYTYMCIVLFFFSYLKLWKFEWYTK